MEPKSHSEIELDLLAKVSPDAVIIPFKKEIVALCHAFGTSGQSGGSAPMVAGAISQAVLKLMMHQTIAPLTGEDDEWADVTIQNDGEPLFQNMRDSRVFKEGKDGRAYFIDAIIFDGDIGGRYHGSATKKDGEIIHSNQYVKSFPFTPKTFFIDVTDHRFRDRDETQPDPNGDWWAHSIKDENRLVSVFNYYDKKEYK